MSVDWKRKSREAKLSVDGDTIVIRFEDGRRQVVFVEEADTDSLRLWSVVARPAAVSELESPDLDAWRRNRYSELVGFSVDQRGRMIGETWVPAASLSADEWGYLVRNLARACDRYEYLLTGRDES
jgi:hypothetical protein